MITAPVPVAALPAMPDSSLPEATFDATYEAFNVAMSTAFRPQVNAVAANVFENSTVAFDSANTAVQAQTAAAASAAIAVGASNAIVWVSGTTYAFGDVRWSPVDGLVYRRMVAGAGSLDPSVDGINWVGLSTLREVDTPVNFTPVNGTTGIFDPRPTLVAGAFASLYGATFLASQWQVSTSTSFVSPFYSSGDQAASTSFLLPDGVLAVSATYFWRVRYRNSTGTYSAWSLPTSFATGPAFLSYIATPTATPASFGAAFEGGFYTGLIWNELAQSSSSFAISTGSKTFVVPNMSGAAIVYAGQQLEVRSRANPANKMVGTVTLAYGTTLELNITSVTGSGTFADWSVMAQYRLIVAPKASGETNLAIKNANTDLPVACRTLTEGLRSTQAMKDADTSTVYPAAWWARGLTIGGRTDWYIPARDELELCWRNLKPNTANNTLTARSVASFSYQSNGAFADTATTQGTNNNSFPIGAAYTAVVPAQTAVTAFRTGGSEVFQANFVVCSSEFSTTLQWSQGFDPVTVGVVGVQNPSFNKSSSLPIRAYRRSII